MSACADVTCKKATGSFDPVVVLSKLPGDAGTFYIGWDKGGPYLAVINKDNSQQVSFRLSDSGNDNKPSTVSIDLKTNKADTLWQAR